MEPAVKAMSVQAPPSARYQSEVSATEEAKAGCLPECWPDFLVDLLLPEVPPGDLEQSTCGIPTRFVALIIYFGSLLFSTIFGWRALIEYSEARSEARNEEVNGIYSYDVPPLQDFWLPSLVLLAVYHLVGPLPRALGDLLCVQPGGYYLYKLQQNDLLNRRFAFWLMSVSTAIITLIQLGVFFVGFVFTVVEQGVSVPAAIVIIVSHMFTLGQKAGMANAAAQATGRSYRRPEGAKLLREGLYSDPHGGGSKRRMARQKLVWGIVQVRLLFCVTYSANLAFAAYKYRYDMREDYQAAPP